MSLHKGHRLRRRLDYALIEEMVAPGSRVLDLGCGDGTLLSDLMANKGCQGRGIEISESSVAQCISRGVPVFHGDMLEGMTYFGDGSFDVVILSQTLQQTSDPLRVIAEMLRVGQTAIISFPNFGHWRVRLQLLLGGRMPGSDVLPYPWYNTPNVHLCTVADFRDICEQEDLVREREIFLVPPKRQLGPWMANLRAELAIFKLSRLTIKYS